MPRANQKSPQKLPTPALDLGEHYYTPKELSGILNLSMSTLAEYRRNGLGPQYISVGYRSCRYAKTEVLKYIDERTRASTSATKNYNLSL